MDVVYFSSVSENTKRFVGKLGMEAERVHRIPLYRTEETLVVHEDFILVVPTYGGGSRKGADVPPQVIRFLNDERNRSHLRGVVACGNTNFGADFCRAGRIVSTKCQVPLLLEIELLGTTDDVSAVRNLTESKTYVNS